MKLILAHVITLLMLIGGTSFLVVLTFNPHIIFMIFSWLLLLGLILFGIYSIYKCYLDILSAVKSWLNI